ncbi:tyrosyl-tRNA synthetase, partial [Gonapodya sp. JEL0774]
PDPDQVWALTLPLVLTASGEKFGKSAGNAVWLDEGMCGGFEFYQFFRRTPDSHVRKYLEYFTFIPMEEIAGIMRRHEVSDPQIKIIVTDVPGGPESPHLHIPQRTLAAEVTEMVHGASTLRLALLKSRILFDTDHTSSPTERPISSISARDIEAAFRGDPRMTVVERGDLVGQEVVKVAVEVGAVVSKSGCTIMGQALKLIHSGGFYLNDVKCTDPTRRIVESDLVGGRVVLMRTGKSNYQVVVVRDGGETGNGNARS